MRTIIYSFVVSCLCFSLVGCKTQFMDDTKIKCNDSYQQNSTSTFNNEVYIWESFIFPINRSK